MLRIGVIMEYFIITQEVSNIGGKTVAAGRGKRQTTPDAIFTFSIFYCVNNLF